MKIFLVGADSQTGRALEPYLLARGVVLDCLLASELRQIPFSDLRERYREQELDFIVNVHHIDGFVPEGLEQEELEWHHVLLPQTLSRLAESLDIPLLHLSDYQVFSGMKDKPYVEEDEPHSQTLYGVTRWQGELSVQRFCQRFIILRVGTLFCGQGTNVLTVLLNQWKKGKARELSTVLQFSPTPTADVARVIYAILQQLECGVNAWGLYHYCSADTATPYDFAEVLLAARTQYEGVDNEIRIRPLEESLHKRKKRKAGEQSDPINTVMVCEKILNTFGIRQRPWRGELTRMVKQIAQEEVNNG
jgi:dTDP-4-dehydrorhamnose reductase